MRTTDMYVIDLGTLTNIFILERLLEYAYSY